MSAIQVPHLVDRESIRAEAASQYGQLNDAAQMIATHKANIDPNVETTMLKKVNVEETQKVTDDLFQADDPTKSTVGEKLAAALGSDHGLTPLDAAVRGHALSVVSIDETGRPYKHVVPYTDRFKSVGVSPAEEAARANAQAEAGRMSLGAEARALIETKVAEAAAKIRDEVTKQFARANEQVEEQRVAASEKAEAASGGGPGGGSSGDGDAKWPRTHEALDELGAENDVEFTADDKVDAKIAKLEAAGVTPPEE